MIYKTTSTRAGHVRVIFELPSTLWADRIYVVGDFDQDQPSRLPLQPLADRWQAALDLPVGRQYRFHYWVDGEWRTEAQADGFVFEAGQLPASLVDLAAECEAALDSGAMLTGATKNENGYPRKK